MRKRKSSKVNEHTYQYVIQNKAKPKPRKKYSITLILIGANLLFYIIAMILLKIYGVPFLNKIALQPSAILKGQNLWTIITSMFMHSPVTFMHLFVNMISLFFLGSFLEKLIGSKKFILWYFITGIVGGLFFILFSIPPFSSVWGLGASPETLAVGASGAIFGLGGILAILTPKIPVYIMLIPIPMPLWLGILIMFGILWAATAFLPIGNSAHLGGLIAGIAFGLYLRKRYKKKVAMLDRYFKFRR